MATRSESLGQDLKAWAADQLQVAVGSAPPEVRAGYLRQTRNEFGAPNLNAREALLILTGRTCARPALALEAAELQLHREMDDFASRFFSLPIAERKAEWERLHIRGRGFVRVDARLEALRPGIYIMVPHFDPDSLMAELTSVICELFVLRPQARAARRQDFSRESQSARQGSRLIKAAKSLRKQHAAIAALEPELIARLADSKTLVRQQKKLGRRMRRVGWSPRTKMSAWQVIFVVCVIGGVFLGAFKAAPPPKKFPFQQNFNDPRLPNYKWVPEFDPNDKNKIIKSTVWIDDNQYEVNGGLEAAEELFGKEVTRKLLNPHKGQPAEPPKDKKVP
jgi:hypothetical protein